MRRTRWGAALLPVVLALVAPAVRVSPLYGAEATTALRDDDVMANVNGTVIYRKSVREVVQGVIALEDAPPDAANVAKLAADALDSLIALELLYQESQARGVTVSDADVDAEIGRARAHFPDAHSFDTALKERGMTQADLRRDTRKTMAVNRLLEGSVWKDVHITPEQSRAFYEQHREDLKHPAQVRASHILIRVPEKASAAERAAAQKRAAGLLDALKAGADFAELARQKSDDPASAPRGGDLGYFAKGEMDPAFEKVAFALAPGQLSDVVSTPHGLHIIKVTDRRSAGYDTLDDARERITALLTKMERERRETELVATLRKKAKIDLAQPTHKE
jgi:parvulin-like peptidyl-prolyl isomerase